MPFRSFIAEVSHRKYFKRNGVLSALTARPPPRINDRTRVLEVPLRRRRLQEDSQCVRPRSEHRIAIRDARSTKILVQEQEHARWKLLDRAATVLPPTPFLLPKQPRCIRARWSAPWGLGFPSCGSLDLRALRRVRC